MYKTLGQRVCHILRCSYKPYRPKKKKQCIVAPPWIKWYKSIWTAIIMLLSQPINPINRYPKYFDSGIVIWSPDDHWCGLGCKSKPSQSLFDIIAGNEAEVTANVKEWYLEYRTSEITGIAKSTNATWILTVNDCERCQKTSDWINNTCLLFPAEMTIVLPMEYTQWIKGKRLCSD